MINQAREMHATVICLQESKILLVRKEAPEWSLPGGKLDPGETQLEAASRELQEETCLQLTGAQFLGHHPHQRRALALPNDCQPVSGAQPFA